MSPRGLRLLRLLRLSLSFCRRLSRRGLLLLLSLSFLLLLS
jgi:hypothetical protein